MDVPVADLIYAKSPTIGIIDAIYNRYSGKPENLPAGITRLGDVRPDALKLQTTLAVSDPPTARLIQTVFDPTKADPTLFGTLDRDDANGIGFVAFRGTETGQEWLDDFLFPAIPFEEVPEKPLVHLGFHQVYKLVRDNLMASLSKLNGLNQIIVTGHSLGAAVASLCALDLVANDLRANVESTTFASPKSFFLSAQSFDHKVAKNLRVANPADIVTYVPPLFFLYVHVKGGFEIDPKSSNFHSLDETYAPGLQKKIDHAGPHGSFGLREGEKPNPADKAVDERNGIVLTPHS